MKFRSSLFLILLFLSTTFAQYVAPNEDTVIVCGGLGTMANAAQLNGGGATKAVWDSGSPSDFINTNGGPKTSNANAAFDYGLKTITATGIGSGITVGTLCFLDDGAAEASFYTGIYEVTTVTANVLTFANIELSVSDTDQGSGVTVNVGGAIGALQHVFDNPVNNAALYNRYIYINGIANDSDGTIAVGTAIDIDVNTGSTTTMVVVVGYNSTLAAESQVVLEGTADINAIFSFFKGAVLHWLIRSIDFNAGGANKANYCIYGVGSGDDNVNFEYCIFRNAVDNGCIFMNGDYWTVYNSELKDSGFGFQTGGTDGTGSKVVGCSIHDNSGDGVHIESNYSNVINNLIYDNGGDGINITVANSFGIVMGNTCYANDGDNIDIASGGVTLFVINNVCVGSTGGYGFKLNGHNLEHMMFGYNLSAGNSSGDTDASGTFANLGIGGNIASAQAAADIFTSVTDGSEDFTPKAGSDLIDNALDAGTN